MRTDDLLFRDRTEAGRRLGAALDRLADYDVVVLGLPRGGVPVAAEVAAALRAPLDVVVVRKLGVPSQPEVAMGAVGEGGVRVTNDSVLRVAGVPEEELAAAERRERAEVERRARLLRGSADRVPVAGRVALVVDDGVATGSTALAACRVVRALGAARIVVAVPVTAPDAVRRLSAEADEVLSLTTPDRFSAVGEWYHDFTQVTDDEVARLLAEARRRPLHERVTVLADGVSLPGWLTVPPSPRGVVVFAHGSGSGYRSPRNVQVAEALNDAGLATLLFDLLTPHEAADDRTKVFDVALLARRLADGTSWVLRQPSCTGLDVGWFGASTGAAAALWAVAKKDSPVRAVVSRGGRPDLAAPRLGQIDVPTLLIVGADDDVVLDLNRRASALLRGETGLAVVPGATHLFAEPGALEAVARLAADWFVRHLPASTGHPRAGRAPAPAGAGA